MAAAIKENFSSKDVSSVYLQQVQLSADISVIGSS